MRSVPVYAVQKLFASGWSKTCRAMLYRFPELAFQSVDKAREYDLMVGLTVKCNVVAVTLTTVRSNSCR